VPDFVGGAGGGGGLPAVEVLVGLVVGAGGGTLRPVVCGLGGMTAPANLRIISKRNCTICHWWSRGGCCSRTVLNGSCYRWFGCCWFSYGRRYSSLCRRGRS